MKWARMWTKRPYHLPIMALAAEATVKGFKKIYPESAISRCANYWENGLGEYTYPEEELGRTAESLSLHALEDPEFFYSIMRTALEKSVKIRRLSEKYAGKSLAGRPTPKLAAFFKEFCGMFLEMYAYGTSQSFVGYSDDNPLYEKMDSVLREKTAREPEKYADHLLALTRPPKRLKTTDQELAVLRLAKTAKEKGARTAAEALEKLGPQLEALASGFGWLSFDFFNTVTWDAAHYAGLVAQKLGTNPGKLEEEIASNLGYEKNARAAFKETCAKLGLSPAERRVFELIRDLGCFKWMREFEFAKAWYNVKFVQDELGRRCGLSTAESKYVLANEFQEALSRPLEFRETVRKRMQNMLLVTTPAATTILAGKEARAAYSQMEFAEKTADAQAGAKAGELKGMPARAGRAAGAVRIINSVEEMAKMREGDVLVSNATNPQLLPAMKKAAAIVTDEGGITCHAAIVAREMGTPCIVGTKFATKVFKDGDLVEVDAIKGIVKKI